MSLDSALLVGGPQFTLSGGRPGQTGLSWGTCLLEEAPLHYPSL